MAKNTKTMRTKSKPKAKRGITMTPGKPAKKRKSPTLTGQAGKAARAIQANKRRLNSL